MKGLISNFTILRKHFYHSDNRNETWNQKLNPRPGLDAASKKTRENFNETEIGAMIFESPEVSLHKNVKVLRPVVEERNSENSSSASNDHCARNEDVFPPAFSDIESIYGETRRGKVSRIDEACASSSAVKVNKR